MYQILLQMHFIWFKILKDFFKNFDTKIVNEKKNVNRYRYVYIC